MGAGGAVHTADVAYVGWGLTFSFEFGSTVFGVAREKAPSSLVACFILFLLLIAAVSKTAMGQIDTNINTKNQHQRLLPTPLRRRRSTRANNRGVVTPAAGGQGPWR